MSCRCHATMEKYVKGVVEMRQKHLYDLFEYDEIG